MPRTKVSPQGLLVLARKEHEVVEAFAVVAIFSALGDSGKVVDLAGSLVERFEHSQVAFNGVYEDGEGHREAVVGVDLGLRGRVLVGHRLGVDKGEFRDVPVVEVLRDRGVAVAIDPRVNHALGVRIDRTEDPREDLEGQLS